MYFFLHATQTTETLLTSGEPRALQQDGPEIDNNWQFLLNSCCWFPTAFSGYLAHPIFEERYEVEPMENKQERSEKIFSATTFMSKFDIDILQDDMINRVLL